jgi:hypothetical protein
MARQKGIDADHDEDVLPCCPIVRWRRIPAEIGIVAGGSEQ